MILESLLKSDLAYDVEDGKYVFKKLEFTKIDDDFDKLKNKIKKFEKLYSFLISMISPVFNSNYTKKFLNQYASLSNQVILNIGSGNSKISDNVLNIDIFAYDNVDIVCDIESLPFIDNSVDIILNIAVLEHVSNPQRVIDEIHRVLKPNGIIYTEFPFIQGFHASPYDYTRVTEEGVKNLHNQFNVISVKPFGGPTSGMLWIFQEWLAILFSFGNKKVHMIIFLAVMVLTFPIKFLDYFLVKHPLAKNIASGFVFIGSKK
jgi:SAM-dependent methyltransferase